MGIAILFLVAWVGLTAAWIAAIVSLVRAPDSAYQSAGRQRGSTTALIVLTGWIGAIYYWLAIKRDLSTST